MNEFPVYFFSRFEKYPQSSEFCAFLFSPDQKTHPATERLLTGARVILRGTATNTHTHREREELCYSVFHVLWPKIIAGKMVIFFFSCTEEPKTRQ